MDDNQTEAIRLVLDAMTSLIASLEAVVGPSAFYDIDKDLAAARLALNIHCQREANLRNKIRDLIPISMTPEFREKVVVEILELFRNKQ